MRKLIVNADDLGLTPGCNQGIIRAMTTGIVSDTSLMINTDFTQDAVDLLNAQGIDQVGLHLNLSYGQPLTQASSLVDENGLFHRKIADFVGGMSVVEMTQELAAQLRKFQATGLKLTHLDGHHHIHTFPEILAITLDLAKQAGVPVRQTGTVVRETILAAGVVTTDHFSTVFYGPEVSQALLRQILADHPEGSLEIMCHPAVEDDLLADISSYHSCRYKELCILIQQTLPEFLQQNHIWLCSFADLEQG